MTPFFADIAVGKRKHMHIPPPTTRIAARAPAKVNLTLRVPGRRPDGYHELDSLVVFAGAADLLTLSPGDGLSLSVAGATAAAAGPEDDNLVLRAARNLASLAPGLRMGRFELSKQLPVAAGLGGGSSDAAAALRLLGQLNAMAPDDERLFQAAAATGADVPVCLALRARVMAGLGEVLGPPLALPALYAVLVNPRVAVPTPAVFRALGAKELGAREIGAGAIGTGALMDTVDLSPDLADMALLRRYLVNGGNDLERPAMTLCAAIGAAIDLLAATEGNWLARMSGSGATVFGLYHDRRCAVRAARRLRQAQPDWWVCPTMLGDRSQLFP